MELENKVILNWICDFLSLRKGCGGRIVPRARCLTALELISTETLMLIGAVSFLLYFISDIRLEPFLSISKQNREVLCNKAPCFSSFWLILLWSFDHMSYFASATKWSVSVRFSGGGLPWSLHRHLLRRISWVRAGVSGRGRLPADQQELNSALPQHPLLLSDAALPIFLQFW